MLPIDWTQIIDRLLRYYYPVLFLIPVLLTLCIMGRRDVKIARKVIILYGILLLVLIANDVIEFHLSTLPAYTVWRVITSVPGFCIRPFCLYLLLLETIPVNQRSSRKKFLLALPAIVNAVIFCSAFFSPLAFSYTADNSYTRGPLFFMVILVGVLYLISLTVSAHVNRKKQNTVKNTTLLFIGLACFTAAVLDMNGVVYPTPLLNQAIAIGMALYFLLQYMEASARAIENLSLSLLLMQIRPHFINNCLAAIRGMIRRNPDQAIEALNHFSGYLQVSMNSIMQTNLIPFSQELGLIDNYLYMEQSRFRDGFTITKDLIPVDFLVPPLTVQPLVENAVRHGLHGLEIPGRLTIRTGKDAKEYRITVQDNGHGFDTSKPPDESRPHVGLQNIRSRLDLMCNGTLDISSGSGGTIATIHIPIRELNSIQSGEKNISSRP